MQQHKIGACALALALASAPAAAFKYGLQGSWNSGEGETADKVESFNLETRELGLIVDQAAAEGVLRYRATLGYVSGGADDFQSGGATTRPDDHFSGVLAGGAVGLRFGRARTWWVGPALYAGQLSFDNAASGDGTLLGYGAVIGNELALGNGLTLAFDAAYRAGEIAVDGAGQQDREFHDVVFRGAVLFGR